MPVLPNGEWVDEEEYRQRQFQELAAQTVPMSGTVLGTNYSFTPTTENLGLNLSWDDAPNLSAGFTFDPSVSSSNAFLSDYDISASGMANVGDVVSPQAQLGLTAGIQGTDISDPNPYMDVGITDVVPGLDVSTGTNIPSTASFTSSAIPGLGISKTSGGPTEAAYSTEISPGVNLNLGTGQGGNVGVTASGAWDDAGKMFRQFLGAINPISDAGADASVPEIAVAPSMQGVDYSQALADVGMAAVPMVDVTDQLSYEMQYPGLYGDNLPDSGGVHDAIEHIDAIYGGVTTTSNKDEGLRTRWKDTVVPLLGLLPGDSGNTVIEK